MELNAYLVWGVLILIWVLAAVGSGLVLALLAVRLHPGLSFRRLWVFYTALVALLAAVALAVVGL